ncbi:MAG: hypothetical protein JXA71_01215, partial [Chitinispirillaceae bacterium]|nr:hypothetical protein [Chitinispirillaceae bacterium]
MVRMTLIMAMIIGTASYRCGMASCPFSDEQGPVNYTDLKNARRASLDEPCLMLLIDRMKKGSDIHLVDQLTALVETRSKSNGFSLSLLSKCAELQNLKGDAQTGKRITALWESRNKPFAAAVSELTATGSQERADSLFVAFDRCITLGADALLWWARIKEIRNDSRGAVGLYCRAMTAEPRVRSMVFSRISQFLETVSADSVRPALGQLQRCIFSLPGTDTTRMQLWLADAYARHGCIGEEIDVLGRYPPFSPGIATRLLDIARKHFRSADYPRAVKAARLVVEQVREVHKMHIAATVLSHSYDALGMTDSALYWLERGDLTSGPGKIEAASLYQRHGQ